MGRKTFVYDPKIGGNQIRPELIAYPCLFLLDWQRRDYVDVFERETKVSQHSRYDRTLSVNDLQKLAEMPPELNFLLILCSGFDFHGRSTLKIDNIEARIRTINSKLKGTMQPELRETLTKLANNREFTKELVSLIKGKMAEKLKLLLNKNS